MLWNPKLFCNINRYLHFPKKNTTLCGTLKENSFNWRSHFPPQLCLYIPSYEVRMHLSSRMALDWSLWTAREPLVCEPSSPCFIVQAQLTCTATLCFPVSCNFPKVHLLGSALLLLLSFCPSSWGTVAPLLQPLLTSLGGKLLPWSLFTSRGLMFSLKVTTGFSPESQLLLGFRPVDSTDFSPGLPSVVSDSITDVSCRMRFSLASLGSSSINSGISVINNSFPTSLSHWISLKKQE